MSIAPYLLLAAWVAQAPPAATPEAQQAATIRSPAEVRAAFLKALDRPHVPLDVKAVSTTAESGGLVAERLSFASEKKADGTVERVPTLIVRPSAGGRHPAVVVLHGTGGTKDGVRSWLDDLAKRGFVAVAIDARYHGDRVGRTGGADDYVAAITRAWRVEPGGAQEHPFYFDTCWDLWRTLDYLETRPDVDSKRIGMLGISMGGIQTWLAAAVDERVAAAVPAIAVQSFRWGLENEAWQGRANTIKGAHEAAAADLGEPKVNAKVCRALWDKVIPGITADFDGPSMLRLFVPRPLLILNGERDPNCPIAGARLAFRAAETAYDGVRARDRLTIDVAAGVGHAVTPAQHRLALDWLQKWLR